MAGITLSEKRETEKKRLSNLPVLERDPRPHRTGVLLSNDIEYYAKKHKLIDPFSDQRLKPAAYELTVGDEWYMGGTYFPTHGDPNNNIITILPFDVVVIKTAETLCIPRFMIARWNIRVRFAYKGLLWVGAPQVDAGYKGHLFCPLYNLSDKAIRLDVGDAIAVIDFVKTCPHVHSVTTKTYPDPPVRCIIQDYELDEFKSALVTKAERKLGEFENSVAAIEERLHIFFTLTFAVLAIIVSVLAVPGGGDEVRKFFALPSGWLLFASSAFSLTAFFLSWVAVCGRKVSCGRNLSWSVCTFAVLGVLILGAVYHELASRIDLLSDRMSKIAPPSTSAPSEPHAKN